MESLLEYSFERYYETSGLFGTPETCARMVDQLQSIDVDEIACLIDFGVDSTLVLDHLHDAERCEKADRRRGAATRATTRFRRSCRNITSLTCSARRRWRRCFSEAS